VFVHILVWEARKINAAILTIGFRSKVAEVIHPSVVEASKDNKVPHGNLQAIVQTLNKELVKVAL